MKRFTFLLVTILAVSVTTAACSNSGSNKDQTAKNQGQSSAPQAEKASTHQKGKMKNKDLIQGIDKELASVQELKFLLEKTPDDVKKINQKGEAIEENWDRIEKQVEENYPKAYHNIEDSLYPLIAIAKKGQPNIENLKQLTSDTIEKLTQFKKKFSTQPKGVKPQPK